MHLEMSLAKLGGREGRAKYEKEEQGTSRSGTLEWSQERQ